MLRAKKRKGEVLHTPGMALEFPPWAVSAYQIALKHGFRGTEREYRMSLVGQDGIETLPMLLVTDADEADIPEDYDTIMRPSPDGYAYYTTHNEFREADKDVPVPDGLSLSGRTLKLSCAGIPFGNGTVLPEAELPQVSAADNGKVIKVVSGDWAAASL